MQYVFDYSGKLTIGKNSNNDRYGFESKYGSLSPLRITIDNNRFDIASLYEFRAYNNTYSIYFYCTSSTGPFLANYFDTLYISFNNYSNLEMHEYSGMGDEFYVESTESFGWYNNQNAQVNVRITSFLI